MNTIRKRIASAVFAAGMSWLGLGAGVASADGVRVIVPPPPPVIFYPAPKFNYDNGYYRTNEGHYYHYDRDRDGWHYGRSHGEGQRYEERRGRHGGDDHSGGDH